MAKDGWRAPEPTARIVAASGSGLTAALRGWAPGPVSHPDRITAWSVAAFSALLDLPPVARDADPLPPLWHWLGFLDHPRAAELGADGHPAAGRFLPPIPDRRRMIAGGRLRVHAPIVVGEPVVRRSHLLGVEVKRGRSGELVFVTVRHEIARGDQVLVTEEQDVVYRSQPPGTTRPTRPAPAEDTTHVWSLRMQPGTADLFRFSALTYNSHRIHYDAPYAIGVEGYPGPVVHGPLLALLLLEIARRHLPQRAVRAFDYRLTSPVFAGEEVVAGGTLDGSQLGLSATGAGRRAITATATLG